MRYLSSRMKPCEINTDPCYMANLIPMSPNYGAREGSPGRSRQWGIMQLPTTHPYAVLCKLLEAQSLQSCPQNIPRQRERCDKLWTTTKRIYPFFVRHGQNDQVDASAQLNSEKDKTLLVRMPNSNQLQWKLPPCMHSVWLSLSYFLLATLQC